MQFLQKAVTDYQNEFVELGKLGIVVGSEPVTEKPKRSSSQAVNGLVWPQKYSKIRNSLFESSA